MAFKYQYTPNGTGNNNLDQYKPNGTIVNLWLFDVLQDPTESKNLAFDPTTGQLLHELVTFYLEYQKTAVPDLSLAHRKADPQADPQKRKDKTWGPFPNSTMCKYV